LLVAVCKWVQYSCRAVSVVSAVLNGQLYNSQSKRGTCFFYRKHCTNTVPWFIGRRQEPFAYERKHFAKPLKIIQDQSKL